MENMYHSKPVGTLSRFLGLTLGLCLLLQQTAFAQSPQIVADQRFEVAENALSGASVGFVLTNDNPGQAAVFSIVEGVEASPFTISSSTGELTVSSTLDYESVSSYVLKVRVEEGEDSHEADVQIYVTDVAEIPSAKTESASNLSITGATVEGVYRDNGAETTAYIQYNTTGNWEDSPQESNHEIIAAGNEEGHISFDLSDLEVGTEYFYRAVASNSAGEKFGEPKSFSTYTIPEVVSINRLEGQKNPTNEDFIKFKVIFSEPVKGVDIADFDLNLTPAADGVKVTGEVTAVTERAGGKEYEVTVGEVDGDGTIRLDFKDDETVFSLVDVPVGGEGAGTGNFEGNQVFTIDNTPPTITTVSPTTEDGILLLEFTIGDTPSGVENVTLKFESNNQTLIPDNKHSFSGTGEARRVTVYPALNQHGTAQLTVTIIDPVGQYSTVSYNAKVRAIADKPIVEVEDVEGNEDTAIPLKIEVAVADDSEEIDEILIFDVPTGAKLSVGETELSPESGTDPKNKYVVTEAQLESLTFTPALNHNIVTDGIYTLGVKVRSRETEKNEDLVSARYAETTETFTVKVNAVNDAPVFALSPSSLELIEDFKTKEIVQIIPAEVPADEVNQKVSYHVAVKGGEAPIADVQVKEVDGKFQLEISAIKNLNGPQTFVVTAEEDVDVNDPFRQHSVEFELNILAVNDEPVFTLVPDNLKLEEDFADPVYVAVEPGEVPADEKEQEVTYTVAVKDGAAPIATVEVVKEEEEVKLKITSIANAIGKQVFVVTANDGQEEYNLYTQEFELEITAVNDAPLFSVAPTSLEEKEDFEDTYKVVITPAEVPVDEAAQQVTYSISTKDGKPAIVEATVIEEEGVSKIKITAKANANGHQILLITATENVEEPNNTHVEEFEVTIEAVNDIPVFTIAPNSIVEEEDFTRTYEVVITPGAVPADEEEQPVTYSVSTKDGKPAIVATEVVEEGGVPKVKIRAKANANGHQILLITATEGVEQPNNSHVEEVEVTIEAVNDAPVFTIAPTSIKEEEDFEDTYEVVITPGLVPADEATQQVSYSVSTKDGKAAIVETTIVEEEGVSKIKITAKANANGHQIFLVTATEDVESPNKTHVEELEVTIEAVNDAPVFTIVPTSIEKDEDFTGVVEIVITPGSVPEDEAAQQVSYSVSTKDGNPAIVATEVVEEGGLSKVKITAIANANGHQVLLITATENVEEPNNSHAEELEVKINAVNDAPAFTLSTERVEEDEDFAGTVSVELTDLSPEDETESIRYTLSPASVEFATININAASGNISITSKPDMFGSQDFILTATDEYGLTSQKPFRLVVNPVNDAPEFTLYPEEVIVNEDFETTERVVPTLLLPFKWGEEEEEVRFSLRNGNIDFAEISIDAESGVVSINAIPDKNGEQMISLVATDNGRPAPAEFVVEFLLRVVPVDDEPVLAGSMEDQVINEDEAYLYTIPAGIFTDPDGDESLSFSATLEGGADLPQWLSFDPASKTFSGTPDGPDVGDYIIEVVAEDPTENTIRDSFKLTVLPVNDLPVISQIDDVAVSLGDAIPEITFTVEDEETPEADLQISIVSDNQDFLPASAIALSGEGKDRKLVLTPGLEASGIANITISVSDGEAEVEENFTFTVLFKELAVNIPDLITPNGDRANDTWNIRYLSLYETNQIRVFDRYGRLVFEAKDYHKGREWDGTQGGNDLPEGAYLYELILNNGAIKKQGTITIVR